MELEGEQLLPGITDASFDTFVLSTCVPSHVRAARKGVDDWIRQGEAIYYSPSLNVYHHCDVETCTSWVIRFVDGVRICAISGKLLMPTSMRPERKRDLQDPSEEMMMGGGFDHNGYYADHHPNRRVSSKRHQDKPIEGSSAYLVEKFSLESSMQMDHHMETRMWPRLNQYPYN